MSNQIELQTEGRRVYVTGNTFPIKSALKDAGGHWDGERKAWWIGVGKREVVEKAIAEASNAPKAEEGLYDGEVKGKVEYKGHPYFVICESGNRESLKLVAFDGKLTFWAKTDLCTVLKRYEAREERSFRGRAGRSSYPTLAGIRRFVEQKKSSEQSGRANSGFAAETKQCWECGCAFTYADAKANDGDWSDSYCGC